MPRCICSFPPVCELPVQLDLTVPVDQTASDVSLDVRAVIPLSQTQLHDPMNNLRLVFEPIVRALYNLPNNFGDAGQMVSAVMAGQAHRLAGGKRLLARSLAGFFAHGGLGLYAGERTRPAGGSPGRYRASLSRAASPRSISSFARRFTRQGGPEAINPQAGADAGAGRSKL